MGKALLATHSGGGSTVPDNSTRFTGLHSVNGNATNAGINNLPIRHAGTVSQLKTYVSANTTLVTSTITVQKNGTDQTLKVTYTSGQTGEKQDTLNSFSVTTTDVIDVDITVANDVSGATSIIYHSVSVMFETTDQTYTISYIGAGTGNSTISTASKTFYWNGGNISNSSTTERTVSFLNSYTLSNFYTYVSTNTRTTTCTLRVRKNTANGNQTVAYTSGQTGIKEDTLNTDSIISGDNISFSLVTSTGTGNFNLSEAITILKSSAEYLHYYEMNCSSAALVAVVSTVYSPPIGGPANTATEANAQVRIGFDSNITNLRTNVTSNTATTNSTITLRVEGSNSVLQTVYTTGQTGIKTDTDVVPVLADNLLGYQMSRGTSGTFTITSMAVAGFNDNPFFPKTIIF